MSLAHLVPPPHIQLLSLFPGISVGKAVVTPFSPTCLAELPKFRGPSFLLYSKAFFLYFLHHRFSFLFRSIFPKVDPSSLSLLLFFRLKFPRSSSATFCFMYAPLRKSLAPPCDCPRTLFFAFPFFEENSPPMKLTTPPSSCLNPSLVVLIWCDLLFLVSRFVPPRREQPSHNSFFYYETPQPLLTGVVTVIKPFFPLLFTSRFVTHAPLSVVEE